MNRGYGGRLLQATGFLIHVATDAREKAPNLLGDPFNSFSRGNDGIWRDDANGCEYFPLASDDVNLLAFERETLLSNPSEFVACDMHCFNPNILQCMNGETHIALFDLDYSNFMMNYAEDDEEVKTVPSSVRHAILQKLPQNHRSCAHEELEKVEEMLSEDDWLNDDRPPLPPSLCYPGVDWESLSGWWTESDAAPDGCSALSAADEAWCMAQLGSIPENSQAHGDTESDSASSEGHSRAATAGWTESDGRRLADLRARIPGIRDDEAQDANDEPEEDWSDEDKSHSRPLPQNDFVPTKQMRADIQLAHDNCGHPSVVDFTRMLRLGGCRPEVADWVRKNFRCPECDAHKHADEMAQR